MKYYTDRNWFEQERRALEEWNNDSWLVYWLCQGITEIWWVTE